MEVNAVTAKFNDPQSGTPLLAHIIRPGDGFGAYDAEQRVFELTNNSDRVAIDLHDLRESLNVFGGKLVGRVYLEDLKSAVKKSKSIKLSFCLPEDTLNKEATKELLEVVEDKLTPAVSDEPPKRERLFVLDDFMVHKVKARIANMSSKIHNETLIRDELERRMQDPDTLFFCGFEMLPDFVRVGDFVSTKYGDHGQVIDIDMEHEMLLVDCQGQKMEFRSDRISDLRYGGLALKDVEDME